VPLTLRHYIVRELCAVSLAVDRYLCIACVHVFTYSRAVSVWVMFGVFGRNQNLIIYLYMAMRFGLWPVPWRRKLMHWIIGASDVFSIFTGRISSPVT